MKTKDTIELLFIQNSSKDDRGRRVMVRQGVVENTLWPDDILDPVVELLGVTKAQQKAIQEFFARDSKAAI